MSQERRDEQFLRVPTCRSATVHNKNKYGFIAREEIHNPADLRGEKIGIAKFWRCEPFSVLDRGCLKMFFTLGKRVATSAYKKSTGKTAWHGSKRASVV